MTEFPAEDAAEQQAELVPDEDGEQGFAGGAGGHGDEVDPADAAEQDVEVPLDEDEWR